MNILVTGHKGYIGSHLYAELKRSGHHVVGVDLKDGEDVLHCLPNQDFDYVFHLSACPRVQYSVERPMYTMRQNVLVTSAVLEWARDHGVRRVVFSSSAAASDIKSPYGLHKKINEMECKLYSELYGLDTVCLRYFNVYSEDQKYGGPYSTAICAWMEMIRQRKPLRIDGDGQQTRDFIHVKDIVSANLFCMNHEVSFNGKVFDLGSGQSVSLNYIKNFVDKYNDVHWHHAPARKGDIKNVNADISDMLLLGWKPKIKIENGLKKCFKGEKNES